MHEKILQYVRKDTTGRWIEEWKHEGEKKIAIRLRSKKVTLVYYFVMTHDMYLTYFQIRNPKC